MKREEIKEKINANIVGAGPVSAQCRNKLQNDVGAGLVSAQETQNKSKNHVGVAWYATQNGITLISLIITIIILLILAGVTINLAMGENGIFGLAENAGKNYMDAQEKEKNMIAQTENYIYNSRQVSQKEYDDLLRERDYLKEELQKSKKIIYLGQGNSFDLKDLQDSGKIPLDIDLSNISIDNFIIGISSVSSGTTDVVQ